MTRELLCTAQPLRRQRGTHFGFDDCDICGTDRAVSVHVFTEIGDLRLVSWFLRRSLVFLADPFQPAQQANPDAAGVCLSHFQSDRRSIFDNSAGGSLNESLPERVSKSHTQTAATPTDFI
jgi:hypothetical protein